MSLRKKSGYLPTFHKTLSLPALLKNVRTQFDKIVLDDAKDEIKIPIIPLTDVLLSGLAVFNFKFSSLLQFDRQRNKKKIKANLTQLFGIKRSVCDTQMRTRLDEVNSHSTRPAFVSIHKTLQKNHVLDDFNSLDGQLLFASDGTDYFKSDTISCPCCNIKNKKNGVIEYSHRALVCSIVHPDRKQVLPLFHEDIQVVH